MKPSIQGRTILRATSHNGTRQLVTPSGQPASPGLEMGLRQQNNIQPKPNSYQQGFMVIACALTDRAVLIQTRTFGRRNLHEHLHVICAVFYQ